MFFLRGSWRAVRWGRRRGGGGAGAGPGRPGGGGWRPGRPRAGQGAGAPASGRGCRVDRARGGVGRTWRGAGRIAWVAVPAGSMAKRGELLVLIDTDGTDASRESFGIVGRPPQATKVRAAPFVRK